MASYTKQMMDLAKAWLEVNADPEQPFLKIPRYTAGMAAELVDIDAQNRASIKKARRYLAENPNAPNREAVLMSIARISRLTNEMHADQEAIVAQEDDVERLLNRHPQIGHAKHEPDGRWGKSIPIGRWCLAWARHGYNTIEISPDFAAAMLLTDPRELDIASVRMPFRGILFLIPDGFARGREGGGYTKVHVTEISRVDAVQLQAMGEMTDILMDGTSPSNRTTIMDKVRSELAISERMMAQSPLLSSASKSLLAKDEVKLLHIYATDGVRALETTIDRAGLTWDAFDQITNNVDSADDIEAMRAVRQIVFGALAYATAIPSATTAIPSENSRAPRRGSDPSAKRWEIGRTIRIDHNLVRAVRGGAREVLYRLKHRHIVRGHYRNQAHGAGRLERKTLWITPYWKGPADGAALVHTYKVDTEGES